MGRKLTLYTTLSNEILAYYSEGHTVKETAKCFGVKTSRVNYLAKARRVSNGRTIKEINTENALVLARKTLEDRETIFAKLAETKGWKYLGGYTSCKWGRRVQVRCLNCGAVKELAPTTIKGGTAACVDCKRLKTKKRKEFDDGEKYRNEILRAFDIKSSGYQRTLERKLNKKRKCSVCGNPYTLRYWKALTGSNYSRDPGVCSMACREILRSEREKERRRVQGRNGTTRKRCKQFGVEYSGHKITWQTYAKRHGLDPNNLVCALCGKICDPNDHSWSVSTGPLHPSIDHIIPLHRGGGDNWENVQIACMECNSRKGDKIAKEVEAV